MKKSKLFLTLYAATTVVFFELIGRLMLAEIIALINLPFINIKKLIKKYLGLKIVLSSLTVILFSLILSDTINESAPVDFFRGWSLIIFTMISTIFFTNYLSKNPSLILYYLFTIFIVKLIFGEGDLSLAQWEIDTNYFKVRFVGFLNPFILLISYFLYKKDRIFFSIAIFVFYGIVCLIMDARSNGLIYIISSFLLYLKVRRIKFTPARVLSFGVISIIILYTGYVFYVSQVLNKDFGGRNAKMQLSMASNPYNPFELIYYGRVDFFVLFQAIKDRPFLGHGSWSEDKEGKYSRITASILGINKYYTQEYIRTHSIFLGAWVWAGIVSFLAILFMFYKLFKFSLRIYIVNNKYYLLPIIINLFIDMVWAFFFSPIGSLRTSFPLFAALISVEYERIQINRTLNKK